MGFADAKKLKLYLRLPEKIVDEQQIKDLHPAIVKVNLPRQRSRRWCYIEIDSDAAKTVKELRSIKINGRSIYVKLHKIRTGKDKIKKVKPGAGAMLQEQH